MKLSPSRVDDVPIAEVSGLAVHTRPDGAAELLAISDRSAVLARATAGDGSLEWTTTDLEGFGEPLRSHQFEGIAVAGTDTILLLRESPPSVVVVGLDSGECAVITLVPPRDGGINARGGDPNSMGEGLVPLRDGRLLAAKEKNPRLLVELAPPGSAGPGGVAAGDVLTPDTPQWPVPERLEVGSVWAVDAVDDLSDLAFHDGRLFVLSDQSRAILAIDLPLRAGADRAEPSEMWKLDLPKKDKPEGLVVLPDGAFLVALDTKKPRRNLLWFRP